MFEMNKLIRKQLKKQKSISIISNYYNKKNDTTHKYDKYPKQTKYHIRIQKQQQQQQNVIRARQIFDTSTDSRTKSAQMTKRKIKKLV